MWCRSRCDEFAGIESESFGDRFEGGEAGVAFGAFDGADVGAVEARGGGEIFLAHSGGCAQPFDVGGEPLVKRGWGAVGHRFRSPA